MSENKKQKSILDFFKSNKSNNSNQHNASNIVCNDLKENKPTDNNSEIPNKTFRKPEDLLIDVNYVDENLLHCFFDEDNNDIVIITKNNADFYYDSFRNIIKIVLCDAHHEHLFDENDWNIIQDFTSLDGAAQLLFIKLYMRKHTWIKKSSMKYPQIDSQCSITDLLKILTQHNFLQDSSSFKSIEEGLSCMTVPQLEPFFKKFIGFTYPSSGIIKEKIISRFQTYIQSTRPVFTKSSDFESDVLNRLKSYCHKDYFRINEEKSKLFDRIFLLYHSCNYFLDKIENQNENQWYRYVLGEYDRNNQQIYPVIKTNKVAILYSSREEFIKFAENFSTLCQVIALLNRKHFGKIIENILPSALKDYLDCFQAWSQKDLALNEFLRPFTATGLMVRIIHQCLTALDKALKHQEYIIIVQLMLSQTIYGTKYRPHWYTRCCIISESRLKNHELTQNICLSALQDTFVKCHHRIELYTRLTKVKKTASSLASELCPEFVEVEDINQKTIYADYMHFDNETNRKNFFFSKQNNGDTELLSVEEVVLRHYRSSGYPQAIHCESSVYQALFGLLFWDIIYSEEYPDSFHYHGQIAPLDLNFDCFYKRRKNRLEHRVVQISEFDNEQLENELLKAYDENNNKKSIFTNFEQDAFSKIVGIAKCLTGPKIAKILQFLARDWRYLRKGFPDLICWNLETKQIKIVEVKGPKDRLSDIQKIWLSNLKKLQIDAEVCYVKPMPI